MRLYEHQTRHFDYSAPMRLNDILRALSQYTSAIDGIFLPASKTDAFSTVHAVSLQPHSLAAVTAFLFFSFIINSGLFWAWIWQTLILSLLSYCWWQSKVVEACSGSYVTLSLWCWASFGHSSVGAPACLCFARISAPLGWLLCWRCGTVTGSCGSCGFCTCVRCAS